MDAAFAAATPKPRQKPSSAHRAAGGLLTMTPEQRDRGNVPRPEVSSQRPPAWAAPAHGPEDRAFLACHEGDGARNA